MIWGCDPMTTGRHLIVNADDFGQSPGVNRGIVEAHERGIVTSASLMVRWPAAPEAAGYARKRAALSLGLHFDLGEWAYRGGGISPLYEVVPLNEGEAVAAELSRQLAIFRRLVGKGPTHLDSHQHVHVREPIQSVLAEMACQLGVPLRLCSTEVRYCGDFYGQTAEGAPRSDVISVDGLIKILAMLPPGLTELGCHPGQGDDLETMYRSERANEVKVLCDPRVRAAIVAMGIELHSFGGVANSERPGP